MGAGEAPRSTHDHITKVKKVMLGKCYDKGRLNTAPSPGYITGCRCIVFFVSDHNGSKVKRIP